MKVSLFVHMERTDDSVSHPELYANFLELCQMADQGGFCAIWVGEHHGMDFTIAPNPFAQICDLANRTSNVRLGTATIVRVHALKPAMLPVLSYLGPAVAGILTGSVVVEQVFGIPGMGEMFVRAALNRDYTIVLGVVVFYATLIVALNLVVDILYGVIDPRVRYR